MPERKKEPYDSTREPARDNDENATAAGREIGSENLYEGSGLGITPTPEGDDAGENRVSTSLTEE